jgi:hypothetical protein
MCATCKKSSRAKARWDLEVNKGRGEGLATFPASRRSRRGQSPSRPSNGVEYVKLPSAFANGSWRVNRNPSPPPPRGKPHFHDVKIEDVFFLRTIPSPASSVIYAKIAADSNPWGHPVVVVEKHVSAGVEHVKLRVCTSFGSRREEEARTWSYHQYLLIENQEDISAHRGISLVRLSSSSAATFRKRTFT